MSYQFIPTKKAVIKKRWTITSSNEDAGKLESSYIDHGKVKLCNHFGRQFVSSLKR